MRLGAPLFALGLAALAPSRSDAQAARVGRLPVLELPSPGIGSCRNEAAPAALQRQGIARMLSFHTTDSSRLITLGVRANGGPVMLMAMMSTDQGRRGEGESVDAFFRDDSTILTGRRRAFTTGMPSRLSDDRQLGLLPGDTLAVRRLATALRKRCRA